MDANTLKKQLSENDLLSILEHIGAEPYLEGNAIVCRTICHNGSNEGKHKLYYYIESATFHCFTDHCGNMDIYGLIGRVLGKEFFDSYMFVLSYFGYEYDGDQIDYSEKLDMSFFKRFETKKINTQLPKIEDSILNIFHNMYHISWIKDGISKRSMNKFNIKLSITDEQIIIPHYDMDNNLVGIRCRNLKQDVVERGMKYMPIRHGGVVYNHPTGSVLYGLNINKEDINRTGKVILFESEKSVLQLDTMYPDCNIGVCVSGSSFSDRQLEILKKMDIEEVVIAFDKEFNNIGDESEKYYAKKIQDTVANKLLPYFSVSVIWDTKGLLNKQDSPTDKGKEVFDTLMKERISI